MAIWITVKKRRGRAWLQQILYERKFTSLRGVIIQGTHKREDQGFFSTIFPRNAWSSFCLLFDFRFWLISVFTTINQSWELRKHKTNQERRKKKLERSKESQIKQMFQISVGRWIEKEKGSSNKKQRLDALWQYVRPLWHIQCLTYLMGQFILYNIRFDQFWYK